MAVVPYKEYHIKKKIIFYKVMYVRTVFSQCWLGPRKTDLRHMQSSEIKFLRSVKDCVEEKRKQNETIRKELNIQSVALQAELYKGR